MWQLLHAQQAAAQQQAGGEQAAGAAAAAAGDSTPPAKRQAVDAAAAAAGAACTLPATIFSAGAGGDGSSGSAEAAVEAAAQVLHAKAQAHLPLVHLKWGLWGLIQDKMSDVDFDYLAYGKQRIECYHACKRALLAP